MAPRPKLTMSKADINTAIISQFKADFPNLTFEKDAHFIGIENSNTYLTMDDEYTGSGEYNVSGKVNLCSKSEEMGINIFSYRLNFRISVSEENGSPKVDIISPISCGK